MNPIYAPLFFGGGFLNPASIPDLAQWLIGYDGEFVVDKLSPLVVDPEPSLVGVNCRSFNGTNQGVRNVCSEEIGTSDFRFSFVIDAPTQAANTYIAARYYTSGDNRSFYFRLDTNNRITMVTSEDGFALDNATLLGTLTPNTVTKVDIFKSGTNAFSFHDGVYQGISVGAFGENVYETGMEISTAVLWTGSAYAGYLNGKLANQILETTPNVLDIYHFIGQSNLEGVPLGWGSLPAPLQTSQPHYYEAGLDSTPSVITNSHVKPRNNINWGPELTFAERLYAINGRKAAVIKTANGGTNMYEDWQKGGQMYDDMWLPTETNAKANIEAQGYTYGDHYLIIMQGESDASSNQTNADAWGANFAQMVSDMQADLGVSFKQVTVGRISDYYAGDPRGDSVRAQQEVAGTDWVDTDSFSRHVGAEEIHYDPDGLQQLGYAFAEKVNAVQSEGGSLLTMPHEEGAGDTSHNVDGSGNHGTGVGVGSWSTMDGTESYFHANGGRLVVQGVAPYIPVLLDGSAAADGLAITNPGCANNYAVHNGSECGILQSNGLLWSELWAPGGVYTAVYWADFLAHNSHAYNTLLQFKKYNNAACILDECVTYGQAYQETPAEYLKNERWINKYGVDCGAGSLVPAEVTAGTGIGPNGTWADNGEGKILLVEDA